MRYRALLLLSIWGGLYGCSMSEGRYWPLMNSQSDNSAAKAEGEGGYSLESLLAYMEGLSKMPSLQRLKKCRGLVKLKDQEKGLGNQIRLALVLMATDRCVDNDAKLAMTLLEKAMTQVEDPSLKKYLAYQQTLASRLYQNDLQQRRMIARIAKLKKINYLERRKRHSCTDELQETREKLEALKAIEKSLNHTGVQ